MCDGPKQILFVCTGNTCRSPMAAGYFSMLCRHVGLDHVQAASAGTAGGGWPVAEQSVAVLREHDAEPLADTSRGLDAEAINDADLVVVMTDAHCREIELAFPAARGKVRKLLSFIDSSGDVWDPVGGTLDDYRACFRLMRRALDALADRLAMGELPPGA